MFFALEKTSNEKKAFNTKTDKIFNWVSRVPWEILGIDSSDGINMQELLNLQQAVNVEADGLIGRGTLRALQHYLANQLEILWNPYTGEITKKACDSNATPFVVWNGLEIPILTMTASSIRPFNTSLGIDMHGVGNFSKKTSRVVNSAIVHWGGLNPQHLARVFSNRKASSHFAIGRDEDTGVTTIFQYIDIAHVTWHAKGANDNSIGIDVCQQPETKHLGYYVNKGYNVKTISNPTAPKYGPSKIISLDPEIQQATIELLAGLRKAFNLPSTMPRVNEGLISQEQLTTGGVFSHFNVDFKGQGKWDVAPWWDAIVDGVENLDSPTLA